MYFENIFFFKKKKKEDKIVHGEGIKFFENIQMPDLSITSYDMLDFKSDIKNL